jgi:hypothetical protein
MAATALDQYPMAAGKLSPISRAERYRIRLYGPDDQLMLDSWRTTADLSAAGSDHEVDQGRCARSTEASTLVGEENRRFRRPAVGHAGWREVMDSPVRP